MLKLHRAGRIVCAALFGLSLLLCAAVGSVSAAANHATVISATPGLGAVVMQAPTTVAVVTAENMNPDPAKTNLFVYNAKGKLVSNGDATVDINQPTHMSVPIKADGDGVYVVQWKTVSADDGDPDQGAFSFTVNPAGANATGGNAPILPVSIAALIALLVGLGLGIVIKRNRPAAATVVNTGEINFPVVPEKL